MTNLANILCLLAIVYLSRHTISHVCKRYEFQSEQMKNLRSTNFLQWMMETSLKLKEKKQENLYLKHILFFDIKSRGDVL